MDTKVGFYDNSLQNTLRMVELRVNKKIPKPCLSQKNIEERLCFVTIHKDWSIKD